MKKFTGVAAGTCAVLLVTGIAWSSNGTAVATSKHHGWPVSHGADAAAKARAATATAVRSGDHALTVIEHEVRSAGVDVGEPGDSPGDYFLFESKLTDPRSGKVVGWDSGKCMLVVWTFRCEATAKINGKGKIEVGGSFFSATDNRIAVTGGTGSYDEAAGELVVMNLPSGDTQLTFLLES